MPPADEPAQRTSCGNPDPALRDLVLKRLDESWTNLHHPKAALAAEFALEGEKGTCTSYRPILSYNELAPGVAEVTVAAAAVEDVCLLLTGDTTW